MATYIQYNMEDGSTVLVEGDEVSGDVVKASRGGVDIVSTGTKFAEAFASVRGSLRVLVAELDTLNLEDAEVKFGLKAIGEAGLLAIGKIGGEMNYEITLRWKRPEKKPKAKTEDEHI